MIIKTYQEAFQYLNIPYNTKAKLTIKQLESEGYKEKNICYAQSIKHKTNSCNTEMTIAFGIYLLMKYTK